MTKIYIASVGIIAAFMIMVVLNFSGSYTTSLNKEDGCNEQRKHPSDVLAEITDRENACKVIGKGTFHDSEFVHLQCKLSQDDEEDRFVFGTKAACVAFKELSGFEYLKLHISTVLPGHVLK